jgi:hypothetical protein
MPEIMHEEYVLFELNMDTLNSFLLFTKNTTNQNQKGKGYAFKDFILYCLGNDRARKERRYKDSADDESLPSTSTVPAPPTPPACK